MLVMHFIVGLSKGSMVGEKVFKWNRTPTLYLIVAEKIIVAVLGTASYSLAFRKRSLPTHTLQYHLICSSLCWYYRMPRNAVENDERTPPPPSMCLKLFKFLSYRAQGKRLFFFASKEVSASVPLSIFKKNLILLLNSNCVMSAYLPFAK